MKWFESHHQTESGYRTIKEYSKLKMPQAKSFVIVPSLIRDILSKQYPNLSKGLLVPDIFTHMTWLAPIRTKPQKTYDRYDIVFSPEGKHTPYLIRKLVATEKSAEKFLGFVKEFGEESGLFESIDVKKYGRSVTSPFELDITLGKDALNIVNVGYGVSQALPIIVELFIGRVNTWYAVQQPEIHLHPRAQAAMGKLFYMLAMNEQKKFIVETHSDFTIDNFRINYREKTEKGKPNAQVVFFERSNEGGNTLYPIEILENGELSENQPANYRDFFMKEQMRLLGL